MFCLGFAGWIISSFQLFTHECRERDSSSDPARRKLRRPETKARAQDQLHPLLINSPTPFFSSSVASSLVSLLCSHSSAPFLSHPLSVLALFFPSCIPFSLFPYSSRAPTPIFFLDLFPFHIMFHVFSFVRFIFNLYCFYFCLISKRTNQDYSVV